MSVQVSRCDLLVQVVGARNVPLRVEVNDENNRNAAGIAAVNRSSPNRNKRYPPPRPPSPFYPSHTFTHTLPSSHPPTNNPLKQLHQPPPTTPLTSPPSPHPCHPPYLPPTTHHSTESMKKVITLGEEPVSVHKSSTTCWTSIKSEKNYGPIRLWK